MESKVKAVHVKMFRGKRICLAPTEHVHAAAMVPLKTLLRGITFSCRFVFCMPQTSALRALLSFWKLWSSACVRMAAEGTLKVPSAI